MALAVFLSIMAGFFGVFQAGLNKVIADSFGYTMSLVFNGFFFLFFNLLFFVFVFFKPGVLPNEFKIHWVFEDFHWWWFLPGFMGFSLVMGLALAVGRIGATQTFIISIAAQIFASILWDFFHGDHEINGFRLTGAIITLVGAVLATSC